MVTIADIYNSMNTEKYFAAPESAESAYPVDKFAPDPKPFRAPMLVIAGNHRQYVDFCHNAGISEGQAHYVSKPEHLLGWNLKGITIVFTGEHWKNPMRNHPMLRMIEQAIHEEDERLNGSTDQPKEGRLWHRLL